MSVLGDKARESLSLKVKRRMYEMLSRRITLVMVIASAVPGGDTVHGILSPTRGCVESTTDVHQRIVSHISLPGLSRFSMLGKAL